MIVKLLCALAMVALVGGENHEHQQRVFESASRKHGWIPSTRANPTHVAKIVVGVRVRDAEELERTFYEVSDPRHPRYGQHLTFDELGDLIINEEATNAVVNWLRRAGLTDITPSAHGELVAARGSVHVLEKLLNTRFYQYIHSEWDVAPLVAAEHYSMPAELTEHSYGVLGVLPLPLSTKQVASQRKRQMSKSDTDFYKHAVTIPRLGKLSSQWSTSCSLTQVGYICPAVLQNRYNIPKLSSSASVKIGIFESSLQEWSIKDTTYFFNHVMGQGSSAPTSFPVKCWDSSGCYIIDTSCPDFDTCGEANLDMQYVLGLTNSHMHVNYTYQTSESNGNDFVSWIVAVSSESFPSSVYSISYGYTNEADIDSATRSAFDTQAQKLGVRGVSIIVSSGDTGANGYSGTTITCEYWSAWPASSSYVTTVGATQGVESGTTEEACNSVITSGGGFSSYYSRPSYQSSWVASYLSKYESTLTTGFNKSGRGYPDVAMAGHNYSVIAAGDLIISSGTSASAPVFATMIAMINNERAKQNKSSLGFLNTALYTYGTNILSKDVSSGGNKCNAEIDQCCSTGFEAVTGWDPVTGLGSVDYAKLLSETGTSSTTTSGTTRTPLCSSATLILLWLLVCGYLVML